MKKRPRVGCVASGLALPAKIGRPLSQHHLLNILPTASAFFTPAPIDLKLLAEITRFAVAVTKILKGCAPGLNRPLQNFLDLAE